MATTRPEPSFPTATTVLDRASSADRAGSADHDPCPDCAAGLDHCHGTLLLHADGTEECTSPGCRGWWERHDHRLLCDELDRCFCAADLPADLPGDLAA